MLITLENKKHSIGTFIVDILITVITKFQTVQLPTKRATNPGAITKKNLINLRD